MVAILVSFETATPFVTYISVLKNGVLRHRADKTPLAPSAVPLVDMGGFINPPRELSADEINGLIQQFVQTAKIAE